MKALGIEPQIPDFGYQGANHYTMLSSLKTVRVTLTLLDLDKRFL